MFVAALVFRAAFRLETHHDPLFSVLVLDAKSYYDLALRFAAGHFGREPLWYAPLYPWLLAALFRGGSTSPQVVTAVQLVLGAVTAALGVGLGARFSPLAGRVAGGLLALSPVLAFYESQMLYASLAVFLTAAFLFVFVRNASGVAPFGALGGGVLFGLLLLVRTNAVLFAPAAAAVLFFRRGTRHAVLFALGVALALLPVFLRNGLGAGEWTPLTVNGGMIFATGFAEESVGGRALRRTPTDFGPGGAYHREAERESGRTMTLAEASSWHRGRAWERIAEDPAWAAQLTWKKVRLLLTSRETDDNLSFPFVRERAWTLRWAPAPWALMLLPAGAGVAVARRRRGRARREALWLAAFALLYGASLLLFFVNARYRLPLVVPLSALAGVGVSAIVDEVRQRRWRALAGPIAAMAVLAVPVFADPGVRSDPAFEWNAVGAALVEGGHAADGLALLDRAIARSPELPGAHQNRALALMALGRHEDAYPAAVEATRLDPGLAAAWSTQGALLARSGRVAEALPAFRRAVTLTPGDPAAQRNLAQALWETGDRVAAIVAGNRAVAAGDRSFAPVVAQWEAQPETQREAE